MNLPYPRLVAGIHLLWQFNFLQLSELGIVFGQYPLTGTSNLTGLPPTPCILGCPPFITVVVCMPGFRPGGRGLAYRILKGTTTSWRVPQSATIT